MSNTNRVICPRTDCNLLHGLRYICIGNANVSDWAAAGPHCTPPYNVIDIVLDYVGNVDANVNGNVNDNEGTHGRNMMCCSFLRGCPILLKRDKARVWHTQNPFEFDTTDIGGVDMWGCLCDQR